MVKKKATFDLFSLFKIADVAIQIVIYGLVVIRFVRYINETNQVLEIVNPSLFLFAYVGAYQVISFLIQLVAWVLFPEIYSKSRVTYLFSFVIVLMCIVMAAWFEINLTNLFPIICLHGIALTYLIISVLETKKVIFAERKKLRR